MSEWDIFLGNLHFMMQMTMQRTIKSNAPHVTPAIFIALLETVKRGRQLFQICFHSLHVSGLAKLYEEVKLVLLSVWNLEGFYTFKVSLCEMKNSSFLWGKGSGEFTHNVLTHFTWHNRLFSAVSHDRHESSARD